MIREFPGGVWPVMLTPYTADNKVDEGALVQLVEWYIGKGVSGLFAACQSSEMFFLSLEERLHVARTVVKAAAGRVPVIASGHISDSFEDQVNELNAMAETGASALILITNRMAGEGESDEVWRENTQKLIDNLPKDMPLGLYECPYPYKRLMTNDNLAWAGQSGRFHFMKDTCCDAAMIRERLKAIEGTSMRLYNANSSTLLDSLEHGAAGYCGVMANFHPQVYVKLCDNFRGADAEKLSDFVSVTSLIERQCYPVNAKFHLGAVEGIGMGTKCRTRDDGELSAVFKSEVFAMDRMVRALMGGLQ